MPQPSLLAQRLYNQSLVGPTLDSAADVVARMGAVQAQNYGAAKWAIAQRTVGATDADVEQAVADGTILRTHLLRPTWHLVSSTDIRWMLELTAPRVRRVMASSDRKLGLTDSVYRKSNAALVRAVDRAPATRVELQEALQRAGVDLSGPQRLTHLLMRAELDALICSGPRSGNQSTYALLDDRAPEAPDMSPDDALAELATRYFTTRGPATVHDFAWWSGLTVADARRGAESARGLIAREAVDGKTFWSPPSERPPASASATAHFLSAFDEYFVAYKDRSATHSGAPAPKTSSSAPALGDNVILLGGMPAGVWKQTVGSGGIAITTRLYRPVTGIEQTHIRKQAARYAAFAGRRIQVPSTATATHTHRSP